MVKLLRIPAATVEKAMAMPEMLSLGFGGFPEGHIQLIVETPDVGSMEAQVRMAVVGWGDSKDGLCVVIPHEGSHEPYEEGGKLQLDGCNSAQVTFLSIPKIQEAIAAGTF